MNKNISLSRLTCFTSLFCFGFLTLGCGDEAKEELKEEACPLKLNSLTDTEWVYLDGSQKPAVPTQKARLKFYKENNRIMAKYNTLSLSETVYFYKMIYTPTILFYLTFA